MLNILIIILWCFVIVYLLINAFIVTFLYIALKRAMSDKLGKSVRMTLFSTIKGIGVCQGIYNEMLNDDALYTLLYVPLYIITEPRDALNSFIYPFACMIDTGDISFEGEDEGDNYN